LYQSIIASHFLFFYIFFGGCINFIFPKISFLVEDSDEEGEEDEEEEEEEDDDRKSFNPKQVTSSHITGNIYTIVNLGITSILGILVLIASIIAMFVALNVELTLACYSAIMLISFILIFIFATDFRVALMKKDAINFAGYVVGLLMSIASIVYGVVGILTLLTERQDISSAGTTIAVALALVLEYSFFICAMLFFVYSVYSYGHGTKANGLMWLATVLVIFAATVEVMGAVMVSFFKHRSSDALIGFCLCVGAKTFCLPMMVISQIKTLCRV